MPLTGDALIRASAPLAPTPETLALIAVLAPSDGSGKAHTETLYAMSEQIHDALETLRTRIADIEKALRIADRAEEDPRLYGWFEQFKVRADGFDLAARTLRADVQRLTDAAVQLDDAGRDFRTAVETHEDRMRAEAARLHGDTVMVPRTEYEDLQRRANPGVTVVPLTARTIAPAAGAP
jgi:hypothetical protein